MATRFKSSGGSDETPLPKKKVVSRRSKKVTSPVTTKVPAGASSSGENPVKGFMIRWSLSKSVASYFFDYRRFRKLIEEYADRYIFQIELTVTDDVSTEKEDLLSSCETFDVSSDVSPMIVGNYHYQCYIHTKVRIRPSQLMNQLREELVGVQVQPASNPSALINYCMKEETRFVGPFSDQISIEYDGSDLITEDRLYSWQKVVQHLSLCAPDNTSIICIYDPVGGSGKSAFAKYLCYHYSLLCIGYADCKDLLYIVSEFSNLLTYLVDLTRSRPAHVGSSDLYAVLEQIKNGQFISTKYKPRKVLMKSPNLIIFTNFLPNIYSVSPHRWRFYGINQNKHLVPMSTYAAQQFAKVQMLCLERDMGDHLTEDGEIPKKYQDLPPKFSRYYLQQLSQFPYVVVQTSGHDRFLVSQAPLDLYLRYERGHPLPWKDDDSFPPLDNVTIGYPYSAESFVCLLEDERISELQRCWGLLYHIFQKYYRPKNPKKGDDIYHGLFIIYFTPLSLAFVFSIMVEVFYRHLSCFCFATNRYTGLSMQSYYTVESLMELLEPQFIQSDFVPSDWLK